MPIPMNPTEDQFDQYVSNILSVYRRASAEQVQRGKSWYQTAHDIAIAISGDVVKGAGVIAAMSAQTEWNDNVNRAKRSFENGVATKHTKSVLEKAERIMRGEDPATVLPMEKKTGHFYRCIVDPTTEDAVVIDRHAYDVMVGERHGNASRGLGSKKRYALVANAYRAAARQLSVTPATLQAITWVTWIEEK